MILSKIARKHELIRSIGELLLEEIEKEVNLASNGLEHLIDELFADCVMPAGVIVRRVLLPVDQLIGMEKLTKMAGSNFI